MIVKEYDSIKLGAKNLNEIIEEVHGTNTGIPDNSPGAIEMHFRPTDLPKDGTAKIDDIEEAHIAGEKKETCLRCKNE